MFNGLKGRRRLALYVALGLSAGSGVFMDASAAYASDVTIPSTDTAHGAGINGTAETGRKDGNNVTIGETGAAGPAINGDVVGGYAAAGDTANNTVTIRSMIALDPGKAVYGGRSDTGSATGNAVRIVGGHMTNVYGGYTAGAGRVQNNAVTVTDTLRRVHRPVWASSAAIPFIWGMRVTATFRLRRSPTLIFAALRPAAVHQAIFLRSMPRGPR